MRVVAIIQARLGSTRFPRKVLADIQGQTMLQRVIERARSIRGVDAVCVAVPQVERQEFAEAWSWGAATLIPYDGDVNDVLARYDYAASVMNADVVLRMTADCPCVDPELSAAVLREWLSAGMVHAFAHNVSPTNDGWDTEVFSAQMLRLASLEATKPEDREHVTPWMRRQSPMVRFVKSVGAAPKLSVDTPEDLERVRAIYRAVGKDLFSRDEALKAWEEINA